MVKPLHIWTDQIRGRSQENFTLFLHLEKSDFKPNILNILFQTKPVVHIILKFFILHFLFGFTTQIWVPKLRRLLFLWCYSDSSLYLGVYVSDLLF